MPNDEIYPIPLTEIRISDENVRQSGPDKDLQELADSIRKHGQLQPVVLMGEHGSPKYDLIIGQRRFLAHKKILGYKTIKATFVAPMSDTEAKVRSLAENMCRTELTYKDVADAITDIYKFFRRDERKVAKETGLSLHKVRQYIYIEERASAETKRKLRERKVTPIDVQRALQAASDDVEKADVLLKQMQKYDKYQKQRMVKYGQENPKAPVKEIITKAEESVVERQLIVRLSDEARNGLQKATTEMAMEPDEVAAKALEEWLSAQGFMQ